MKEKWKKFSSKFEHQLVLSNGLKQLTQTSMPKKRQFKDFKFRYTFWFLKEYFLKLILIIKESSSLSGHNCICLEPSFKKSETTHFIEFLTHWDEYQEILCQTCMDDASGHTYGHNRLEYWFGANFFQMLEEVRIFGAC